jgi:hypothetical protein
LDLITDKTTFTLNRTNVDFAWQLLDYGGVLNESN